MFEDGALIGCLMLVGGAIVAMVLWGFILPLPKPKRLKFTSPKGISWGKVSGLFINGKLIGTSSDFSFKEKVIERGGLFRIDCGINIPTGRTVGALYKTPTRLQGKAYVYPVGNYLPPCWLWQNTPQRFFGVSVIAGCRGKPIEWGVEGTLPLTPDKQKGPQVFRMLYHQQPYKGLPDIMEDRIQNERELMLRVKSDNQPLHNEARRVMQQRRRPRRVLLSGERTMHEEIMRRKGEDDA